MFFASRQVNDTLHWQSPHSVNTAVIFCFYFAPRWNVAPSCAIY